MPPSLSHSQLMSPKGFIETRSPHPPSPKSTSLSVSASCQLREKCTVQELWGSLWFRALSEDHSPGNSPSGSSEDLSQSGGGSEYIRFWLEDACGRTYILIKGPQDQVSQLIIFVFPGVPVVAQGCRETCFCNIFLASLLLFSLLKTPSCPALLYPIFLLEKQSQCW